MRTLDEKAAMRLHDLAEELVQAAEAMDVDAEVFITEIGDPQAVVTDTVTPAQAKIMRVLARKHGLTVGYVAGTDQLEITLQAAK